MPENNRRTWRIAGGCAVDLCGLAGLALGVMGCAATTAIIVALTFLVSLFSDSRDLLPEQAGENQDSS